MTPIYILFGIFAVALAGLAICYNGLVRRRNQIDNIIGTMDAMLKKRWDLIPNLVSTVKAYAAHERQLFEQVARIRSQIGPQLTRDQMVGVDNMLTALLPSLWAVVERYPDLKASQNFMHLQRTLTELEEQISAARRAYNAMVTDYNNMVQTFPTNLIAGLFHLQTRELFRIEPSQAIAPKVRAHEDTTRGTDVLP
ncbi:MAG: LemA family protein [Sedimentisphaerales bacterium]|nr:LemA family protein [Sedimentisphaerales bacterium]